MSTRPTEAKSRIDHSSKQVLVVDDFVQHLRFMGRALRSIGFSNVELAKNPQEAIAKCEDIDFDIILCDYNMGEGQNGRQLLQEVRFRKQVRYDCIFILVTAETSREVVLGAMESEPEGYIAKPFNEAVLGRKIDRLLDKQACLSDINAAIEQEQYETAIELCHVASERHPRYYSWCLKTAAELHLKLGQYVEARQVYQGCLNERVLDWALLGLARTYIYLGEHEKAITELEQVLVLNSSCVHAHDLLAECHQHLNNLQAMSSNVRQAIKLSPHSVQRQDKLGDICTALGDHEGASKAYQSAVKSARYSIEETADSYFKLAGAITDSMTGDMSSHDSSKAVQVHKVLAELDERFEKEKDTDTRKDLLSVRLYLKQQNPERALSILEDVERDNESQQGGLSSTALFEFARTLANLGDEERSKAIFTELLNRDDIDDSRMMIIRALLERDQEGELDDQANELNRQAAELYEQQDLEGAIKLFSEAARLSPKSVIVNLNLTQALVRYMEVEEVTISFRKQGKSCLENLGKIEEGSPHYARFANLAQRFAALESPGPLQN